MDPSFAPIVGLSGDATWPTSNACQGLSNWAFWARRSSIKGGSKWRNRWQALFPCTSSTCDSLSFPLQFGRGDGSLPSMLQLCLINKGNANFQLPFYEELRGGCAFLPKKKSEVVTSIFLFFPCAGSCDWDQTRAEGAACRRIFNLAYPLVI